MLVPALDEADTIGQTVELAVAALVAEGIDHEVLVIDDGSSDATAEVLQRIAAVHPSVRCHRSPYERGFGFAVRAGLERFDGDAVAILMADGSDDPADLARYHHLLQQGWDCAFGSRFIPGSVVSGYPRAKLVLNRLGNWFIRAIFRHRYNDTTNAFKAYRREVIETIQPLRSQHFSLTAEMPLKAIARGHSFKVIPISWTGRKNGVSKFVARKLASQYLFTVLSVWLERRLNTGRYRRAESFQMEQQ